MAHNCRKPRQTPEGTTEGMRIALLQGEKAEDDIAIFR